MRIIQTFWTKNQGELKTSGGWLSPEYHWMSWALSCLQLRQYYPGVNLYTDDSGKAILIDKLKLPYTSTFLHHNSISEISRELWALSKIYSYSLQEEPFLHIDGDIYIWERFSQRIEKAEAVAQNYEINFPYYFKTFKEIKEHFVFFPDAVLKEINTENIISTNTGIVGGNNLELFKKYSSEAFLFVKSNAKNLDKINKPTFNIAFEQFLYYCLIKDVNIELECYIKREEEFDPTYKGFAQFDSVPYNTKFIHALGDFKKSKITCDHLAKRLRKDYPDYYYRIIDLCLNEGIPISWKCYPLSKLSDFWIVQYSQDKISYSFLEKLFSQKSETILTSELTINVNCKVMEAKTDALQQYIIYPNIIDLEFSQLKLDALDMVLIDSFSEGSSIINAIKTASMYFDDTKIKNLVNEFQNICFSRIKTFVFHSILVEPEIKKLHDDYAKMHIDYS